MALPKIQTPVFDLKLPSTGEEIKYRPFTVKEEKVLLIAQKSDDNKDQINAVKQIINNCIIQPDNVDIDKLASFDIEYLFLKLRAKSVGEQVKVKLIPQKRKDIPPAEVEMNLDEIEPKFAEGHSNMIEFPEENMKLKMTYPTFESVLESSKAGSEEEQLFQIFAKTIDTIYHGDETYEAKDFSIKEIEEFMENMNTKHLKKLQAYFEGLPKLKKEFDYRWVNPEDEGDVHEEVISVQGLLNFLA